MRVFSKPYASILSQADLNGAPELMTIEYLRECVLTSGLREVMVL